MAGADGAAVVRPAATGAVVPGAAGDGGVRPRRRELLAVARGRRLRWIGITSRVKNSPNTWRWFQRVDWAADYPRSALRGVSVDITEQATAEAQLRAAIEATCLVSWMKVERMVRYQFSGVLPL